MRIVITMLLLFALLVVPLTMLRANQDTVVNSPQASNTSIQQIGDDITVELIGLCEYPSQGKTWWKPDGSPLKQAPYDKMLNPFKTDGKTYEIAIKVTGQKNTASSIYIPDAQSSFACSVSHEGINILDITAIAFTTNQKEKTTAIVTVASGDWKTVHSNVGKGSIGTSGFIQQGNFKLALPGQNKSGVQVTMTVNVSDDTKVRLVAVDHNQQPHPPATTHSLGSGKNRMIITAFKNIDLEKIHHFQYQTRQFKKVIFKNISLKRRPTKLATNTPSPSEPKKTRALPALAELDGEIKNAPTSVKVEQDSQVQAIFDKVIAAYKNLNTYKSSGTATTDIDTEKGKLKISTSFNILLKKPNLYKITWTKKNSRLPNQDQSGVAWSDGTQPYLYFGQMSAYSKMDSDENTIGAATGVSGGVAYTIPSLILSAFSKLPAPFERLQNPIIEQTQTINNEACYVISGSSIISQKETYWVSKSSHLILRYARSLQTPEAAQEKIKLTDEELESAVKTLGQTVTKENIQKVRKLMETALNAMRNNKIKGTISEHHNSISSPQLSKDDFTFTPPKTAELKDSLFGDIFNPPAKRKTPAALQSNKVRPIANIPEYVPSNPNWRQRFDKVYRLNKNEVIRYIPAPFIPERMDYYNIAGGHQAQLIPQGPDHMTFTWAENQAKSKTVGFGRGISLLSDSMDTLTGLFPFDFAGNLSLLEVDMPGDWIIRPNQPSSVKLAALEKIIAKQTGQSIHFKPTSMVREVLIVKGHYQFNPIPNVKPRCIHVYSQEKSLKETNGFDMGNIDKFLHWLGKTIKIPVINEIETDLPT